MHFYAPTNLKTLPKHVLFVLDISGSMAGRKIEQLREALIQILGDVSSGDFISLILFSDSAQVSVIIFVVNYTVRTDIRILIFYEILLF